MKWLYLTIPAILIAVVVSIDGLSLGHAVLHFAAPAMAAVPLYLSAKAYIRAGGSRFMNLTAAFGFLFAGQVVLSCSMYTATTVYIGDIPLDHFLHYVAFVFFTAALLERR